MYGLVLGGGGAKGSYQIGVWKALDELKIEVGYVCGTSVGALNGAFFAQKQYKAAYDMWSKIDMNQVFNADDEVLEGIDKIVNEGVFSTSLHFLQKTYKNIWSAKGLDISPLRAMISDYLDEDLIRKSNIGFGLVTISIDDKKALRLNVEDIKQGELKYYLLGSAMIPGFTQDEKFHKKFVDGGVYDNFPIKMAYEKGYRDIIGVSLFPKLIKTYKDANVTIIQPSKSLGNILYFNHDIAKRNMELGYLDTMKQFGKLQGYDYFFKNIPSEQECLKVLCNLRLELKKELSIILTKKELESEKHYFEKVLYKLGKDLGIDSNGTYQDIYIKALEVVLKEEKADDLLVYDFKKTVKKIKTTTTKRNKMAAYIIINSMY